MFFVIDATDRDRVSEARDELLTYVPFRASEADHLAARYVGCFDSIRLMDEELLKEAVFLSESKFEMAHGSVTSSELTPRRRADKIVIASKINLESAMSIGRFGNKIPISFTLALPSRIICSLHSARLVGV